MLQTGLDKIISLNTSNILTGTGHAKSTKIESLSSWD